MPRKSPLGKTLKKCARKTHAPQHPEGEHPIQHPPPCKNLPVPKRQPTHFKELITYILHMCHLIHALVHQRKFLRQIVRTKWIKNYVLYTSCNIIPWSVTLLQRRLTWFGHLNRLPDKAPAKIAFKEAYLRPPKKLRGGQPLNWLHTIKKDFKNIDLTVDQAIKLTKNKKVFQSKIDCDMAKALKNPLQE